MTNKQAAEAILNDPTTTEVERHGAFMMIAGWSSRDDDAEMVSAWRSESCE